MDGAGADGLPTPQYAAYGATKAGARPALVICRCITRGWRGKQASCLAILRCS